MSAGVPSCSTISYTRARSARDLRSNTRPGADQLRCSGSSTAAKARLTSRRGSRSGVQVGFPCADPCWVNDTCGSAARSHPAWARSRAKVATVGDFRPCSYADSVGREVPARRASSSWVRPELTRTRSSSSEASSIHPVYPIGYLWDAPRASGEADGATGSILWAIVRCAGHALPSKPLGLSNQAAPGPASATAFWPWWPRPPQHRATSSKPEALNGSSDSTRSRSGRGIFPGAHSPGICA